MSDLWVVVPGWAKFQYYGNRRDAPWIKVYNELNSRAEWLDLPMAAKGWLVTIWIEYARASGVVSLSRVRRYAPSGSDAKYFRVHMKALSDAGFIQLSGDKPLALRARATEAEEEKKELTTSSETYAVARAHARNADGENLINDGEAEPEMPDAPWPTPAELPADLWRMP